MNEMIAPEAVAAEPPTTGDVTQVETDETGEIAPPPKGGLFWGTGRRKSAIARVRMLPGSGKFLINARSVEDYFRQPQDRTACLDSLLATKTEKLFDVFVTVSGGGCSGQAGAIRLGVARALVKAGERYEPTLRDKDYLTRDARVVERKKYGQRKARRRFQFSKR